MFSTAFRIWLVNFVLAGMIVFFGLRSVGVWTENGRAASEKVPVDTSGTKPAVNMLRRIIPPLSTYGVVADKNLFSPDRAEVKPDAPGTARPDISKKKIFLYGVVTMNGQKQALVNHPVAGETPAARTQTEDRWVKVGDIIGNLRVAEIEKEKVVLSGGGDRYELLLHDESKPAARTQPVKQTSAAPTVVVTGSEPKTPAAPPAPAPTGGTGPFPSRNQPSAPAGGAVKKKPAVEDGYEIVETPFGPFKRRIK